MSKTKDFDNILDECLERVLSKGETIEQCLASHPERAAELEPLLRTAVVAKKVSAIRPRPEFRDRARYEFRQALREVGQERRRFISWQPRWATAAIAVLVFVVAGSGTLAAANNSMPDEPLYPVKLTAETVRVALTPSALGKAQLYADLADKRVIEIVKMAEKGKPEQLERATQRLDVNLQKVASLAAPQEKPAGALMAPAARPAPSVAATPPGQAKKNGKNEGSKADKRAKVKAVVASNAANNQEALKAVLERAPESAKSALRRAIAVSNAGYQQALKALDE